MGSQTKLRMAMIPFWKISPSVKVQPCLVSSRVCSSDQMRSSGHKVAAKLLDLPCPVGFVADCRAVAVQAVQAGLAGVEDDPAPIGQPGGDEVADYLVLGVDGDLSINDKSKRAGGIWRNGCRRNFYRPVPSTTPPASCGCNCS